MTNVIVHYLLVFSCILGFFSLPAYSDCEVFVQSYSGDFLENIAISFRSIDSNTSLFNTTTDSSGYAYYPGDCGNISVEFNSPFSVYSTILYGASMNPIVHINDWVTARVQLFSVSGSPIEGQDCSVVVYESNSSIIIHNYNTLCQKNEPFLDDAGNWAVLSDCKFSDSGGWYYFMGRVDESMGFEYDQVYDLIFTCNAESTILSFITSFEKSPLDMRKTEDFLRNYSGLFAVIFPVGFILFCLVVVIFFILFNLRFKRRVRK